MSGKFAKKHLGQHFLIDNILINDILDIFYSKASDPVVEIGPGLGALTHNLIEHYKKITCIEIDQRAVDLLNNRYNSEQINVINQDILETDLSIISSEKLNIIGNLPYNISTPILFHLFDYLKNINLMFFMLQKEVIDRITAEPNNKNYGRLSIMCQVYCKAEKFFEIPPEAFDPPPKVDSAMVMLIPHKNNHYKCQNFKLLEDLVRISFNQRRKTIANNLKKVVSKEQLEQLGIDPKLRPENLNIKDFVAITNLINTKESAIF